MSDQVYVIIYEYNYDKVVDVYADEDACEAAQRRYMTDPERELGGRVDMYEHVHRDIMILLRRQGVDAAWHEFTKVCAEFGVYFTIQVCSIQKAPSTVGVRTGRLSSARPNISASPKAGIPAGRLIDAGDGKRRFVKTISIDFDGVIHDYQGPWRGAHIIEGDVVKGAIKFLVDLERDRRFQPVVYSSRSSSENGIKAMANFIFEHACAWFKESEEYEGCEWAAEAGSLVSRIEFATHKPPAKMTIDDRAYRFEGNFPSLEWLDKFIPWNKRPEELDAADYGEIDSEYMDLAEEMLETIWDCLIVYDKISYPVPSTKAYLAAIVQEKVRQKLNSRN